MSLALYRKYRPKTFEDLVGQRPVQVTLLEALKQGRLVHAYLFSGPRGTGKTSTARLIAKAIQCESRKESGEPCGECELCKLSEKGELIDLIEIDAASNRGIDEIRDLREKIRFAPSRAKSKVYIIDEVHMLTKEAFNALLKSLEEPPAHVYFILATTEIHKVPETILSRCQRYDFKRIGERDIVERLQMIAQKEELDVDLGALELLAKYADGGMRDAISLLEQFSSEPLTVELVNERLGLGSHQSCDELFGALGSADTQKGLAVIESLHNEGYNLQQFTLAFLALLRGKLHDAIAANKQGVVPKLLAWIELFDDAWMKLKKASISQLPLEIAVIRATHSEEAAVKEAVNVPVNVPVSEPVMDKKIVQAEQVRRPEGLADADFVVRNLSRVYSAIKHPAIRQSFQTGKFKEQRGNTLIFTFSSQFHYSKVHHAEAIVEIEAGFKDALSTDFNVICELDESGAAEPVKEVAAEIDTLGWDTTTETL